MKTTYLFRSIYVCIVIMLLISCDLSTSAPGEAYRDTSNLVLTHHVKCRMACRQISLVEIKQILADGKLNPSKSGKGSEGDDTYALEGVSSDRQNIRVVVAPEDNGLVVITCIDLDKEWPCNCK